MTDSGSSNVHDFAVEYALKHGDLRKREWNGLTNRLDEIRASYGALAEMVGDQGGGDRTLNDIDFLLQVIDRQRDTLEAVDGLLSDVMTEENLHVYEPVAARVTAVLAEPAGRKPTTEQGVDS